jgi:hypothetical protein
MRNWRRRVGRMGMGIGMGGQVWEGMGRFIREGDVGFLGVKIAL